jgi:uncharacterized integral membrane protein
VIAATTIALSPYSVVIWILMGILTFNTARRFRRRYGVNLWGLPSGVWLLIGFVIGFIGLLLALIASAFSGRGAAKRAQRGSEAFYGPDPFAHYGAGPYGPPGAGPYGGHGAGPPGAPAFSPADGPPGGYAAGPPPSAAPAGWMPDPSGRFDHRYWSGTSWTEHVTTDGVQGSDPPPASH